MITMSLNQVREFSPCESGWEKLLKVQGKTTPDDEQIPLLDILKSNGVEDTIWCFRVNWFEHKAVYMEFTNWCASRAANAAAAAAYAAARAAYAADAADAADAANAAYAAYAADARKSKKEQLAEILKKHLQD